MSERKCPTYEQYIGPFNAIEADEQQIVSNRRALLQRNGWTETCQTPGSYWMWQKAMSDGRVLLVNEATAMRIARHDAEQLVDPKEWGDE